MGGHFDSPGSLGHRDEEIDYGAHIFRTKWMKWRSASRVFLNHKLSSKLRRKLCEMSVRQATLAIKNNGKLQNIHMDLSITCLLGFEKKNVIFFLIMFVCIR